MLCLKAIHPRKRSRGAQTCSTHYCGLSVRYISTTHTYLTYSYHSLFGNPLHPVYFCLNFFAIFSFYVYERLSNTSSRDKPLTLHKGNYSAVLCFQAAPLRSSFMRLRMSDGSLNTARFERKKNGAVSAQVLRTPCNYGTVKVSLYSKSLA